MNLCISLRIAALITLTLTASSRANDDRISIEAPLPEIFAQAVHAKGENYLLLREKIVGRGSVVVPYLEEQSASAELHCRIVGKAMLSWINEPEMNRERLLLLGQMLYQASSRDTTDMAKTLRRYVIPSRLAMTSSPRFPLHQESAAPILLEMALKGGTPLTEEQWKTATERLVGRPMPVNVPEYDLWTRSLAAGLVGGYADPDVIPLLVELLSDERPEVRLFAAAGMLRTKSSAVIEPLIGTLADENQEVKGSAYWSLMRLTQQDFRQGQPAGFRAKQVDPMMHGRFERWWSENKDEWIMPSNRGNAK